MALVENLVLELELYVITTYFFSDILVLFSYFIEEWVRNGLVQRQPEERIELEQSLDQVDAMLWNALELCTEVYAGHL